MHTPFSPVLGSCWLVRTGSLLAERMRSLEAANRSMSRTDREYEPAGEATVRGGGKKKKKKIKPSRNSFLKFCNGNGIVQNRTHKSVHMYLTDRLRLGDLGSFFVLYQCVVNKQDPFNVLAGLVRMLCLQHPEQVFQASLREEKNEAEIKQHHKDMSKRQD